MTNRSMLPSFLSALARDKAGNFGLLAALALPVVLATGGIAIDMTNMTAAKNHLQNATDAAVLAASSGLANQTMTVEEARRVASDYVKVAMQNYRASSMTDQEKSAFDADLGGSIQVNIDESTFPSGSKRYDVTVTAALSVPLNAMTKLINTTTPKVKAKSRSDGTSESKNALSMFLVLDRSGSMKFKTEKIDTTQSSCDVFAEWNWPDPTSSTPCYLQKIATLKTAVANLVAQLKTSDPTSIYTRTAAVSYDSSQNRAGSLDWGTTAITAYVNALYAEGGTDSSGAFKTAYTAIKSSSEDSAHKNKTGLTPKKAILFMTDGQNTHYNGRNGDSNASRSDTETKTYCEKARTDKILVYTVAFMAPPPGQKLLKSCATDDSYYFAADNSQQLLDAFKAIGADAAKLNVRLTQ